MEPASTPAYDIAAEAEKGKKNAAKVIKDQCDIGAAFRHPTLGMISLLYGDYRQGIRHILYRREREIADNAALASQVPQEVVLKLIDVILYGEMRKAGPKYWIEHDGYCAIVACPLGDQLNHWLLSGYKIT